MKSTTILAPAALLASSQAAFVTLATTKCLDTSYPYGTPFDITMNLSGPVARDDLKQICGLRIISASENIDINTITCRAYRDVVGTQPGSAEFTFAHEAKIGTNPRVIKAIACKYPAQVVRRQNNGTVMASSSSVVSTITLPVSSDTLTSSAGPATITSTVVVSGTPQSSANATTSTLSTTLTPSASQSTAPAQSSAAAGVVGVGAGVGLGAIAAIMGMLV